MCTLITSFVADAAREILAMCALLNKQAWRETHFRLSNSNRKCSSITSDLEFVSLNWRTLSVHSEVMADKFRVNDAIWTNVTNGCIWRTRAEVFGECGGAKESCSFCVTELVLLYKKLRSLSVHDVITTQDCKMQKELYVWFFRVFASQFWIKSFKRVKVTHILMLRVLFRVQKVRGAWWISTCTSWLTFKCLFHLGDKCRIMCVQCCIQKMTVWLTSAPLTYLLPAMCVLWCPETRDCDFRKHGAWFSNDNQSQVLLSVWGSVISPFLWTP